MGRVSRTPAPFFMFRLFPASTTSTLLCGLLFGASFAQVAKPVPRANSSSSAQGGISLAESGRCSEALPILRKAAPQITDKDLKLRTGLATVRCAMSVDKRDAAVDALQMLNREFPHDPDVLYASTHAYSDLSARESQDLARTAPTSYQAHELNAEALEMQGKWEEAAKEYQSVLKRTPDLPGIHFRLGRILLSKPDPGPNMAEEAKKEFEQELTIDPNNAGAEYVLGEMARQESQWPEAIKHFSRAIERDAGFGDAFLGLGTALLSAKRFSEAIPPLETAVKLEPRNPAAHYSLATALTRAGRKQDAEKEFAIHHQMTQKGEAGQAQQAAEPKDPN
jgi:tetratricopeptide (TPR) repeat protein